MALHPEPADFLLIFEEAIDTAGSVEHPWAGPPPTDGVHTLRLTVLDQLGRSSEDRRLIAIDSRDPAAEIWEPAAGSVITEPVAVTGMVDDANLSHWVLEEITSREAHACSPLGHRRSPTESPCGNPLPEDGPVILRLSVVDDAGHSIEAAVAVEVSVLPPVRRQASPPRSSTATTSNSRGNRGPDRPRSAITCDGTGLGSRPCRSPSRASAISTSSMASTSTRSLRSVPWAERAIHRRRRRRPSISPRPPSPSPRPSAAAGSVRRSPSTAPPSPPTTSRSGRSRRMRSALPIGSTSAAERPRSSAGS